MSTPASISLNSAQASVELNVSHDGYPTAILPMIAEFVNNKCDSFEDFKAIYRGFFGNNGDSSAHIEHGLSPGCNWKYKISTGGLLSVYSDEWELDDPKHDADDIVNPLAYLRALYPEYAVKEEVVIRQAIASLASNGIDLAVPLAHAKYWSVNPESYSEALRAAKHAMAAG